jgi:transcriptional regulator with XRE-family HTH domain
MTAAAHDPDETLDPGRTRLGLRLLRLRSQAGLSQQALAAAAGLSWRTVLRLERGQRRHPTRATLTKLATTLKVSITELAGGRPELGTAGLALRLVLLRRRAGLSQRALAEASALSPQAIHRIETRAIRHPHLRTLQRLAAALRVPVYELAGDARS